MDSNHSDANPLWICSPSPAPSEFIHAHKKPGASIELAIMRQPSLAGTRLKSNALPNWANSAVRVLASKKAIQSNCLAPLTQSVEYHERVRSPHARGSRRYCLAWVRSPPAFYGLIIKGPRTGNLCALSASATGGQTAKTWRSRVSIPVPHAC